jgi:DNA-binding transcriptional ArsR family regulator
MRRAEKKTRRIGFDPEFMAIFRFLAPTLRREILIELGHGLSTTAELAHRLKVQGSRISYHLKQLIDRKLVRAHGHGRSRSYRLSPTVHVVRQKKADVLTVSINKNRISISSGRSDKPKAP